MSCRLPSPLHGSGKYHRAEFSASVQQHRIIRLERLEYGEKLRLRSRVIPLAIPPEQLQQFVHRLPRLALGIKRLRQIEPRLMIVRISLHGGAQVTNGPCVFSLPRQFELRMRGLDL